MTTETPKPTYLSEITKLMPILTWSELRIYIALANRINRGRDDNEAWPAYETIMEDTGISSRTTISNSIKRLLEINLIKIDKRFKNSNQYTLSVLPDDEIISLRRIPDKNKANRLSRCTTVIVPSNETTEQNLNVPSNETIRENDEISIVSPSEITIVPVDETIGSTADETLTMLIEPCEVNHVNNNIDEFLETLTPENFNKYLSENYEVTSGSEEEQLDALEKLGFPWIKTIPISGKKFLIPIKKKTISEEENSMKTFIPGKDVYKPKMIVSGENKTKNDNHAEKQVVSEKKTVTPVEVSGENVLDGRRTDVLNGHHPDCRMKDVPWVEVELDGVKTMVHKDAWGIWNCLGAADENYRRYNNLLEIR